MVGQAGAKAARAPGPKLTPMLSQYLRLKDAHRDAILMFRLGDFYEMFFEDAERAAGILDITLTSRNKNDPQPIPLCGVPHHAVEPYIQKLLGAGLKVAICEQVEDPRGAKGLVEREVVRVITPGTVVEEENLDPRTPSFLAVLGESDAGFGLAVTDVSTGELRIFEYAQPAEVADADHLARHETLDALAEEINRLGVRELVLPSEEPELQQLLDRTPRIFKSRMPRAWCDVDEATQWLATVEPDDATATIGSAGRAALGGLRTYLRETYRGTLGHLRAPEVCHPRDTLALDEVTRINLNVVQGPRGERRGSLIGLVDRGVTPMGSRTVRRWILSPLTSCHAISRRLDAVEALVDDVGLRADLREALAGMGDVERLVGRIGARRASPRDLARLATALTGVTRVRASAAGATGLLGSLAGSLDPLPDLVQRIEATLVDESPATVRAGPIVRTGYHSEVDELRELARDGKGWVLALEARERVRTGIGSLKVKYNRVSGYAIEVTKANLGAVPEDYIRKQTLAGAERFVTTELKEQERRLLGAEERLRQLEGEIFSELVEEAAGFQRALGANATALGALDTLAGLAELAHDRGYVRPQINDGGSIIVQEGRHPVLEAMHAAEPFVPNDCTLDDDQQIMLITGPNMAGKSTYLRQVGLIVLLAQAGSFVPAAKAQIGVVDRIFTRVGASDDLTAGDSTFMVEMRETANILRELTDRSLVLLDEIGRGTSTYDGIAIAWAVTEYLHEQGPGAKTLFATHFYELTALAEERPRLRNYSVAVREWQDSIVFLRRIVPGPASRSYGVEVARLAGLPESVVERARGLLTTLERGELASGGPGVMLAADGETAQQLGLFARGSSEVETRLKALDVTRMTPIEALTELHLLVEAARGGGSDDRGQGR